MTRRHREQYKIILTRTLNRIGSMSILCSPNYEANSIESDGQLKINESHTLYTFSSNYISYCKIKELRSYNSKTIRSEVHLLGEVIKYMMHKLLALSPTVISFLALYNTFEYKSIIHSLPRTQSNQTSSMFALFRVFVLVRFMCQQIQFQF